MYKNSNRGKTTKLVFLLLLLGGVAHGANAPDWKSETFSMVRAGEVSLPLRITPVLVEAPPRRVDLFPLSAEAGGAHGTSLPLTGLPVDLYKFPVLKFSATGQESGAHGLELGLDTRGTGAVDTLVRVGDPALLWLRPAYAAEPVQSDLTEMNKLDATLSYVEILGGGKNVVLAKTFLGWGEHALNYVADEGVSVTISQVFLQFNRDQQNAATVKAEAEKAAPSKLAKIGLLILAGGLVLLGVKFMPRWAPLMDRALSWEPAFWGIQYVLLNAALYMMSIKADKDAFSWGGLLLVFAYGLAVRYTIRSYLVQKWDFFRQRHSAPYFLLFLAVLLSSAVMLMFKLELAAEHAAVIGYYLLVTGVVIEYIRFAKESKIAKQNEL